MKPPQTVRQYLVCMTLDKGEKWGLGYKISEVRMGSSQVGEEEQNTPGRQSLVGQLRNNGTRGI